MDKETREELAKKEKSISRDHWMCRLQRYCFKSAVPDFYGYCPFFWFTVLCIFISPWIFLGQVFMWLGNLLGSTLCKFINAIIAILPKRKDVAHEPTWKNPEPLTLLGWVYEAELRAQGEDYWVMDVERFDRWKAHVGDAWQGAIEEAKEAARLAVERGKALIAQRKEAEKRQQERKDRMAEVAGKVALHAPSVLRPTFLILKIALVLGLGFCVYKAVSGLFAVVTLGGTIAVGLFAVKWIGIILTGFVCLFIIMLLSILIWDLMCKILDKFKTPDVPYEHKVSDEKYLEPQEPIVPSEPPAWFLTLCELWKGLGTVINTGWAFCHEFVRMAYAQECPLLTIGEETTKIQKRDKQDD